MTFAPSIKIANGGPELTTPDGLIRYIDLLNADLGQLRDSAQRVARSPTSDALAQLRSLALDELKRCGITAH